jgi:hypothetical protein
VDEALRDKFNELSERMIDTMQVVSNLLEAEEKRPVDVDACMTAVESLTAEYQSLLAGVPELDHPRVDRNWGRRITDLRRMASKLPQKAAGTMAPDVADAGIPFLSTQRASYTPNSPPPRTVGEGRREQGVRAGGDIEAWCGPCAGLRDHTIVAIVDGKPKSVICQSCNNKHGYRLTPARGGKTEPTSAVRSRKTTAEGAEARRKEEARQALRRELIDATEVRLFSKRERYKVGEIIEHPQMGRGKVENILKGSLLVRFRDGLKSVSTM